MCKRYASHCVWQGRQNDSNTARIALFYKPLVQCGNCQCLTAAGIQLRS
jgi:hypothetical protein